MKLLSLLEATKKRKFRADDHFRLYMPNGGEDGVLIGWRQDWPENHFIEFRGLPYSQWTHDGDDFQRVHDRLAGMRATVLHHNSVVDIIPGMEEHDDIARAINGGELPEWDKDRAFNESVNGTTVVYNGQPKVAVKPERAGKDVLMMLPTAAMDAAFNQDSDFYVGSGGSGAAIGKRYEGFQQWIEQHDQYEVPEVYVHTDGKLSFTNGRHRYAVLRDAGVDPMPVAMSRSGVENAQRFLKGVVRESDIALGARFARYSILRELADPAMVRLAAPKALAKLRAELAAGIDDANEEFSYATNTEFSDPKFDEKFAIWKEGYAQKRIGMAIKILQKDVEYRDGKMLVHRMIQADENWLAHITERGLGQYWTWDKGYAEAYAGHGSEEWLVSALVDPASIDWVETILANSHPASGQEEKEITIPEGTPVKVVGIEVNGEPVDPSKYQRGRVMMADISESQLDDDYARGYYEGQIEGIKAGKAYRDSPQGQPEFDNFHVTSGRVTKANGYAKAYAYGYQDGYYTMVTGGDAEHLIGKIKAKLAGGMS